MSTHWRLPKGVDEVLPPHAWELEGLRRKVLDVFVSWGYDYLEPPVIEYLDALLVGSGEGKQAYQTLLNRAAVLFAFEQIGGAEQALNMAVAYAKERFAFGRPIGSFQALKHMMADMYVALKLAESNAYYAAWALQNDAEDLPLAAATARVSATQAFQLCARDNIQVHGGMGFTWAFDCHLFYRRSNYLAVALGGSKAWDDHLVNALPGLAA